MARVAIAAVVALVTCALAAPWAGATKPVRIPASDFSFDLSAAVCGFPVHTETVMNNEVITIHSDGRVTITGAFKVRVTNVSQPSHSLVLNISGPSHFAPDGTFKATGVWLFAQEPNPLAPAGTLVITRGNVVVHIGADPTTFSLEQQGGNVTNLCPALA